MTVNKNNIEHTRTTMRKRRLVLGLGAQHRAAYALCQRLESHSLFQTSQHIACYWAIAGELSCQQVIKAIWRTGKLCYLPVIDFSTDPKTMYFKQYRPGDSLLPNRYGIVEPTDGRNHPIENIDCVLTPLTAFDKNNHRIGMGGGFYDRAFEHMHKPVLLGVAYDFQEVMRIEPQPWDVVLDDVVSV